MIREVIKEPVPEGTTQKLIATLKDEDDVVIPASQVQALTLTLYNLESRTIINSRDQANILNAGGGSLHATSGLLTMLLDPADNTIETATKGIEARVALFEWTFATTKKGKAEVLFYVQNLEKVAA